ncbi:MAG: putative mycofactocin radical SAM maturase MftC [candidate division WS2 bacterium]|nr:putative mycofactocin radical SAM maturase MftC [Candidatus Lithacetigena glycinireducens]
MRTVKQQGNLLIKKFAIQVLWHITKNCNLRCAHCYETNNKNRKFQMPLEEYYKAIDNISTVQEKFEIFRLGFLGGEPFIREDLSSIINYAFASGIEKVHVSSNGTLIDKEIAKQIRDAGIDFVQISLEGPNKKINDYIRGNGSFDKALNGIKNLIAAGIPTGIMVTLSKINVKYIEKIFQLAKSLKVCSLSFNRFISLGRGEKIQKYSLTFEDMEIAINKINSLKTQCNSLQIEFNDPLNSVYTLQDEHFDYEKIKGGCIAGIANITIDSDGTVYPCRKLPIPLGNILENKLIEILINNPIVAILRDRGNLKGKCSNCQFLYLCGGCRAAAYIYNGDYLGDDPHCFLRREGKIFVNNSFPL